MKNERFFQNNKTFYDQNQLPLQPILKKKFL